MLVKAIFSSNSELNEHALHTAIFDVQSQITSASIAEHWVIVSLLNIGMRFTFFPCFLDYFHLLRAKGTYTCKDCWWNNGVSLA